MTETKKLVIDYIETKAEQVPMRVRQAVAFGVGVAALGSAVVIGGHALEKGAGLIEDVFYDGGASNHGPVVPGPENNPEQNQ